MKHIFLAGLSSGAVFVAMFATSASALPPAPTSLNACQKAVKVEGKKFVQNYVKAAATCLENVSTDLVQKNLGTPSTATANACVTQYRKINDTRSLGESLVEKLQARILAKCTPGGSNTHTLQDILGAGAGVPQPLGTENLGSWCAGASLGGSGTITALQAWVDCITAAHTCAARLAFASQYPRALDWLPAVQPAMSGLTPPASDPTKVSDALAGLNADDAAIEGSSNDGRPQLACGGQPLPLKTGQTTCYDSGGAVIPCAGTGQDGEYQAGTPLPSPRFTVNGNGTVTDNLTGLMWLQNANCFGARTWAQALADANGLASGACGLSDGSAAGDWRLPNRHELESLRDLGTFSPVLPAGHPFLNFLNSGYWSSTTHAYYTYEAWNVDFNLGFVFSTSKADIVFVTAVRGGV